MLEPNAYQPTELPPVPVTEVVQGGTPIEVQETIDTGQAIPVEVKRGLGSRVKEFFSPTDLSAAGVLTPTEAHIAQDIARGVPMDAPNSLVTKRAKTLHDNSNGAIRHYH